MGPWWQYAAPMFPSREDHASARAIQSVAREFLCRRWVINAKRNAAGARIAIACMRWHRCNIRRRQIISCLRMHAAKQAYAKKMSTLRTGRSQVTSQRTADREMNSRRAIVSAVCSGRTARVPMLVGDTKGLKRVPNGLSVPPGSCVLRVCCSEIEACVGTGNDLLLVVKPSKLSVQCLYSDLSCGIPRRFTLSVNGVKLMPDVFKKK